MGKRWAAEDGYWDGNVFRGIDWNARRRPPANEVLDVFYGATPDATGWDPGRPSPLMHFDELLPHQLEALGFLEDDR